MVPWRCTRALEVPEYVSISYKYIKYIHVGVEENTLKCNGDVVKVGCAVCLDGHLALDAVQRGVRRDKAGGLVEIDADFEARGLAREGVHWTI